MSKNILQTISSKKLQEVALRKEKTSLSVFVDNLDISKRDFKKSLENPRYPNIPSLICEIKKASPSQGLIREDFDHIQIAKLYNKYANCMSVLTDESFFQGNLQFLSDVDEITEIPLLEKDFILDEYQIYEARKYGADCILLIQAILSVEKVQKFYKIVKSLNMDAILEVHTKAELDLALKTDCDIIGVNNRNLETFAVDIKTTEMLSAFIPEDRLVIAESGMKTYEDLIYLKNHSTAVLIGTSIMKNDDIEKGLKSLIA